MKATPRRRRLSAQRRQALQLLASSQSGITETFLFARGVTPHMLARLLSSGLATIQRALLSLPMVALPSRMLASERSKDDLNLEDGRSGPEVTPADSGGYDLPLKPSTCARNARANAACNKELVLTPGTNVSATIMSLPSNHPWPDPCQQQPSKRTQVPGARKSSCAPRQWAGALGPLRH